MFSRAYISRPFLSLSMCGLIGKGFNRQLLCRLISTVIASYLILVNSIQVDDTVQINVF